MQPPVTVKWHQGQSFPQSMPDDEWLSIVGPRNWVVLSQDRKWHTIEAEAAAIKQHKIRCFYMPCASEHRWVSMCSFVRRYEKMMDLATNEPAPFIYELKTNGRFYEVPLP
jgi:hypothetical protein